MDNLSNDKDEKIMPQDRIRGGAESIHEEDSKIAVVDQHLDEDDNIIVFPKDPIDGDSIDASHNSHHHNDSHSDNGVLNNDIEQNLDEEEVDPMEVRKLQFMKPYLDRLAKEIAARGGRPPFGPPDQTPSLAFLVSSVLQRPNHGLSLGPGSIIRIPHQQNCYATMTIAPTINSSTFESTGSASQQSSHGWQLTTSSGQLIPISNHGSSSSSSTASLIGDVVKTGPIVAGVLSTEEQQVAVALYSSAAVERKCDIEKLEKVGDNTSVVVDSVKVKTLFGLASMISSGMGSGSSSSGGSSGGVGGVGVVKPAHRRSSSTGGVVGNVGITADPVISQPNTIHRTADASSSSSSVPFDPSLVTVKDHDTSLLMDRIKALKIPPLPPDLGYLTLPSSTSMMMQLEQHQGRYNR